MAVDSPHARTDSRSRVRVKLWRSLGIAATVIGLWSFASWAFPFESWVGIDGVRILDAGRVWASGGDPYTVDGFLYTPAMAVLGSVLPPMTPLVVGVAEVAVVLLLCPRHPLAWLAVFSTLAVWSDIGLGNVTILIVGTMALALRSNRWLAGVPFGLALALVPKPMFIPILLWMAAHQRRSLAGVVLAGTLLTLPMLMTGLYPDFVRALIRGVEPDFSGNHGLSTLAPILGPVASAISLGLLALVIRKRESGLMAAGIAGVFMGSYVGSYAPVLPMALLQRYERFAPVPALAVAVVGLLSTLMLPVAGGLAFAVVLWSEFHRAGVVDSPSSLAEASSAQ